MGRGGGKGGGGRGGGGRASGGRGAGPSDAQIQETVNRRILAAAEGQPPIVRRALIDNDVSLITVGLTQKEKSQLASARRKEILTIDPNDPIRRRLVPHPRVYLNS